MTRILRGVGLVAIFLAILVGAVCVAGTPESTFEARDLPSTASWWRVLTLADHNTRVVVLGTGLLGLASGMVGSFALLRKRALLGDALSHATLPGIGLAFLVGTAWGGDGKSLGWLLSGAAISGIAGTLAILLIHRLPRLKEDTALGIVLSVFFGAGIAILVIVQQMPAGHAAGLESFIYGKTASMLARDAWLIGGVGIGVAILGGVLFKELMLLCFDEAFLASLGHSRLGLDWLLMGMIVAVTIIGLQAVGLILVIALLVIPPAAARFWTEDMARMTVIGSLIGAIAAVIGSACSAIVPQLPSGATIVLACSLLFLISLLFGQARGLVFRWYEAFRSQRRIGRQHLLRALFEDLELTAPESGDPRASTTPQQRLLHARSWNLRQLRGELRRAVADGEVIWLPDGSVRLTEQGLVHARRLAREHRLWELYLIMHADVAPGKVDRDADMIEHVLEPSMIARLESLLEQGPLPGDLPSPHPLRPSEVREKQEHFREGRP